MPINYPGTDDFIANVHLKAITDPARGGVAEMANIGLQNVADRTTFLQTRRLEDYRAQIEAASGGRATVKADVNGNWHVMARIPAFISGMFDANLVYPGGIESPKYHPAFRLNASTVIPEFLVGLFPVSIDGDGDLATVPGTLPDLTMTLDAAIAAASDLGPGWHVMTAHEYGAIGLYALNRITNLRGNNAGNVVANGEYGRKVSVFDDAILSGTGPIAWRHDGREFGISELVGGFSEYINLIKSLNSKLFFPFYNEFWKGAADWDDQNIFLNKSPADGLNIDGTSVNNNSTYSVDLSDIEYGTGFTAGSLPPALTDPRLAELLLHRAWYTDGTPPTGHWIAFLEGRIGALISILSLSSRYFVRGGFFDDGNKAALPSLLSVPVASYGAQWRVCYIDPALIPA